jgi:hypothetical protein
MIKGLCEDITYFSRIPVIENNWMGSGFKSAQDIQDNSTLFYGVQNASKIVKK